MEYANFECQESELIIVNKLGVFERSDVCCERISMLFLKLPFIIYTQEK